MNKALTLEERGVTTEFAPFLLKEFDHWTLLLNQNQWPYLGRAYLWLVRDRPMHRMSDLDFAERHDLFNYALPAYERALDRLFAPDHLNYAWFGNEVETHGGHGHLHLIPRYRERRTFHGRVYRDQNWGKNYAPAPANPLVRIAPREIEALVEVFRAAL